jgi:hypothetical protein
MNKNHPVFVKNLPNISMAMRVNAVANAASGDEGNFYISSESSWQESFKEM